jgi:hypothetical protein
VFVFVFLAVFSPSLSPSLIFLCLSLSPTSPSLQGVSLFQDELQNNFIRRFTDAGSQLDIVEVPPQTLRKNFKISKKNPKFSKIGI